MAVGKNEEIIGKRIKKARKMMGLRQKELATSVGFKSRKII